MVNFIVAKALTKGSEDRYQNAKDFAADLRTCRDTLPRSGQQIDVSIPPVDGEKKLLDAIDITGRGGTGEEEAKSTSAARLSPLFDSAAATMRLAALTATSEDVDELSRTFNMPRPSAEVISRAAPTVKDAIPVARQSDMESSAQPGGNSHMLVIIVLVALLGIALFIVFR
jgi:serine/threonine-protein kinase